MHAGTEITWFAGIVGELDFMARRTEKKEEICFVFVQPADHTAYCMHYITTCKPLKYKEVPVF